MTKIRAILVNRSIAMVIIAAILTGCAGAARHDEMVVAPAVSLPAESNNFTGQIFVAEVVGGEKTNPLWTSEIDDENFRKALVNSLRQHGLYSESGGDANYQLTAKILGVSQPAVGLSLKVTMHVNYLLNKSGSDEPVLLKTITSEYTATMGEAFIAIKRLRLANQGAARENIKQFIEALSGFSETVAMDGGSR